MAEFAGAAIDAAVQTLLRFSRLERSRRHLLGRATALLALASAAVALLPFKRAIRFGLVEVASNASHDAEACVWAVEAAARRLPFRTLCIEKGLAAQRLLRRNGVDAQLHYGARHDPAGGKLQAHVWVTVAGQPVIGGEEASGFAEVASYP